MPAVSQKQQQAMAIAASHPDQLYARNAGLLKMKPQALQEFASTPRTGLPVRAPAPASPVRRYKGANEP